jgi:hypothetical protein
LERSTRLRRYLRKDYTQLVDFPVEIVGRDGMVRRYSFDDSVRLYHRRIHSAPLRYDDGELVDAEVRHCRQRIDQLRRSYLEHFGWGPLRDGQLGGALDGPLAAEVAAFLRRVFPGDREGATGLRITLVDSGQGDSFYLRCTETGRSWMLYAWRLDGDARAGAREDWRQALARLSSAPSGEAVERLFVSSEGPDLALVLAGTGEWSGPGEPMVSGREPEVQDALLGGLRALYDGQVSDALQILEAGLDASPNRVALAQAAALVAVLNEEPERAEFAARLGLLAHGDDALLRYLLGVALCRRGRPGEVRDLVWMSDVSQQTPLLALLEGVIALRDGRPWAAWGAVGRAASERETRYAGRAGRVLRRWLVRWGGAVIGGGGFGALGVVAGSLGATLAAITLGVAGLVVAVAATVQLRRRVQALLTGDRMPGVPRLVSLELLPRERDFDGLN